MTDPESNYFHSGVSNSERIAVNNENYLAVTVTALSTGNADVEVALTLGELF